MHDGVGGCGLSWPHTHTGLEWCGRELSPRKTCLIRRTLMLSKALCQGQHLFVHTSVCSFICLLVFCLCYCIFLFSLSKFCGEGVPDWAVETGGRPHPLISPTYLSFISLSLSLSLSLTYMYICHMPFTRCSTLSHAIEWAFRDWSQNRIPHERGAWPNVVVILCVFVGVLQTELGGVPTHCCSCFSLSAHL